MTYKLVSSTIRVKMAMNFAKRTLRVYFESEDLKPVLRAQGGSFICVEN